MGPQTLLSLHLSLWTAVLIELPGGSMKFGIFLCCLGDYFPAGGVSEHQSFRTSSLSSVAAGYRGWEERLWSLFSLCKPVESFETKHRGNTRDSAEPKEVGKSARVGSSSSSSLKFCLLWLGLMSDGIGDVSETWSSIYPSEFHAFNRNIQSLW